MSCPSWSLLPLGSVHHLGALAVRRCPWAWCRSSRYPCPLTPRAASLVLGRVAGQQNCGLLSFVFAALAARFRAAPHYSVMLMDRCSDPDPWGKVKPLSRPPLDRFRSAARPAVACFPV